MPPEALGVYNIVKLLCPHLTRKAIMATMVICENFAKRGRIFLLFHFWACEVITLELRCDVLVLKAMVIQ